MSLNMNEFFEEMTFSTYVAELLESSKKESLAELEISDIEEVSYRFVDGAKIKALELKTFPAEIFLAREVKEGQTTPEDNEVGIDYIISSSPIALGHEQTLIQLLENPKASSFGDLVLIDYFKIFEFFKFDEVKMSLFLEKKLNDQNSHLLINLSIIHNAGGSIIDELSFGMYFSSQLLDMAQKSGKKIYFINSMDSKYFLNISKLRALRYFFEVILEKNNIENIEFEIISRSSLREMTLYDESNNMLRNTISTMSSFIGGANFCIPQAYDVLNQVYLYESSDKVALRQSRNIFHTLRDESGLAFVKDASRGSYAIEDLTTQLIEKTQQRLGEYLEFESSYDVIADISLRAKKLAQKRAEQLATRENIICGINNYALNTQKLGKKFREKLLVNEIQETKSFPLRRTTNDFEKLRLIFQKANKTNEKKIAIFYFGEMKKAMARITFAQNYFEVLGVQVDLINVQDNINVDFPQYCAFVYAASDEDYPEIFELFHAPSQVPSFIAGKKFLRKGFDNIYMGQNIFETLANFVNTQVKK